MNIYMHDFDLSTVSARDTGSMLYQKLHELTEERAIVKVERRDGSIVTSLLTQITRCIK